MAKNFWSNGNTNFNNGDSAQAATSYLLPILASTLFYLPNLISVLLFSFFGFLSVYSAWHFISKKLADIHKFSLIFIIFLNTTVASYMLSGWENIHQSLIVLLAWHLAIFGRRAKNFVLVGVVSALAILMRVDSIFLISNLFAFLVYKRLWREFLISSISGLCIGLIYLYFQLS